MRSRLEDLRELRDLVRSLGRGGGWGPLRRAPIQYLDMRARPGLLRTVLEQQETRGLTRSDDISRLLPSEVQQRSGSTGCLPKWLTAEQLDNCTARQAAYPWTCVGLRVLELPVVLGNARCGWHARRQPLSQMLSWPPRSHCTGATPTAVHSNTVQAATLARGRTVRQSKLMFYAKVVEKALQTYERDGWGEFPTQIIPERREIRQVLCSDPRPPAAAASGHPAPVPAQCFQQPLCHQCPGPCFHGWGCFLCNLGAGRSTPYPVDCVCAGLQLTAGPSCCVWTHQAP